jgi:two-component system, NarL family, response regulator DevR
MVYRVFLVEDSPPLRERLTDLLSKIQGVDNVGSAATAHDAERAILATHPHAVLLDIKLAQGSGFDVLRALHAQAPEIEVYMLSNFAAPAYRQLAADLGARGFFDKTTEMDSMRKTIADRAAHFLH